MVSPQSAQKINTFCDQFNRFPAMTSEEIQEKLGLSQIRDRRWHLQLCSALTGQGLHEGLTWLGSANHHTPEDVV
jgi:ADP-ribosylation factor family